MPLKKSAIVQARSGSTRLPRKVLEEVGGQPLIAHTIHRLQQCATLDSVAIATTELPADDAIADFARRWAIPCYRGSEDDVLARYVLAAAAEGCDITIRVTGDCPLIDPSVVDAVVSALTASPTPVDYASNIDRRTYPRGLDVEAFFTDVLRRMDRMATAAAEREHVTVFLRASRPDLFATTAVEDSVDNSDLRLTVDTAADLEVIRRIYSHFEAETDATGYREIVQFLRRNPEITALNSDQTTWTPVAGSTSGIHRT